MKRLAAGMAVFIVAALVAPAAPAAAAPVTKVLVFSKTAGFRHSSIPNGIAAIQQLGAANGFSVTATEDANQFTTANLAQFQAVVFLSTTGDVLNATQQSAFQSYIASGKGYVGIQWAGGATTATCTPQTNPVTGTSWRARANSRYVTTASGNLIASATAASTNSERFDIVDLGGGNVAFRSKATGLYVCAENAGAAPLVANRASAGAWETFARVNNSDGSVSFRAQANGRYVVAENGGAAALIANRTAIGAWEKFDLVS